MSDVTPVAPVSARVEFLNDIEAQIREAQDKLSALKKTIANEKFVADIAVKYKKGDIPCTNERHYVSVPFDRTKPLPQASLRPRPPQWVFEHMPAWSDATCECERNACEWANKVQYSGMPASQWVGLGTFRKGYGPKPEGGDFQCNRMLKVHYTMDKTQLDACRKRFPKWTIYTESITGHDHPIAHTSTLLCSKSLFEQKLPQRRAGEPKLAVLDLNGSPNANERQMRYLNMDIDTACKVFNGKDAIREVKKWGPKYAPDSTPGELKYRWHDLYDREIGAEGASIGPARMREYDVITSIHTLYYYSPAELLRLLNKGKQSLVIEAIVHRFAPGQSNGTLNGGEQHWRRYKEGGINWIEQTNKLTGQVYHHQDPEWLFNTSEIQIGGHALAWDIGLMCEDTYHITLKSYVPAGRNGVVADGPCVVCGQGRPIPVKAGVDKCETASRPAPVPHNSPEYMKKYNSVLLQVGDTQIVEYAVPPECQDLFTEARRRLHAKPRTMDQYQSHNSVFETKLKRLEAQVGKMFDAEVVGGMKKAAFWMDAGVELQVDKKLFEDHWIQSRTGDKFYTLGHNGQERFLVGAALDAYIQTAPKGTTTGLASLFKVLITNKT